MNVCAQRKSGITDEMEGEICMQVYRIRYAKKGPKGEDRLAPPFRNQEAEKYWGCTRSSVAQISPL